MIPDVFLSSLDYVSKVTATRFGGYTFQYVSVRFDTILCLICPLRVAQVFYNEAYFAWGEPLGRLAVANGL